MSTLRRPATRQLRAKSGLPSGAQTAPSQIGLITPHNNAGDKTVGNAGDFSGGTSSPRSDAFLKTNLFPGEKMC